MEDYTDPTPVVRHGGILYKRDDFYCINDIRGGKVRACWHLATTPRAIVVGARLNGELWKPDGLITAGARKSPQMQIVARIAERLGIPCRLHTAIGEPTPEMEDARRGQAEIMQHRPGHNSVIVARAEADAKAHPNWKYIPFGMESEEAMRHTRAEAHTLCGHEGEIKRIVVCVGSGMTLAGILWGMYDIRLNVPVLGIRIGADPTRRLQRYAPAPYLGGAPGGPIIETSRWGYSTAVDARLPDGTLLDPHYESKCVEYLRPGDLFWVVGIRAGVT